MNKRIQMTPVVVLFFLVAGCGSEHDHHGHDHHGHEHQGVALTDPSVDMSHDHGESVLLGTFNIAGIYVQATQAHGTVESGAEGHLVIKLPYADKGATVVRAWIGLEDRTLSSVGMGQYASKGNRYDIHMLAPKPLPANAKWWVEIEKPDGTQAVGSIPLRKELSSENPL
jgi:hypothetical protein